jgi:hypothetical protein
MVIPLDPSPERQRRDRFGHQIALRYSANLTVAGTLRSVGCTLRFLKTTARSISIAV